jgi:hypothetical protein
MSEKKHIDKLFKEQLKNFEATPSDAVWQNIEAALKKEKRKRRVIPIWWKVAGVAAALVLMFTVANTLLNNSGGPVEQKVVDTKKSNSESINEDRIPNGSELNTSEGAENNTIVGSEKNSLENNEDNNSNTLENNLTSPNTSYHKTSITLSEEKEKQEIENSKNETHKNKSVIKNKSLQRDAIVSTENKKIKSNKENSNLKNKNTVVKNANGPVFQDEDLKNDIRKEQSEIDKLIKQTKKNNTSQVTSSNALEKKNSDIRIDSSKTKDLETTENAIAKAIALTENEDSQKVNDSINPLTKRWSVAPNMAPVYFNTLGSGSPIDEQFVDNTKEGDVNVSYGVKGAYAINKKLTIRAGVSKVNLGYSTNNVVAFNSSSASASSDRELQHINISDSTMTYLSANNLRFANGPEVLFLKEQGSISQQLGFIEVPIELEYNVLDTKIGVHLIGGFSTLFLSDNDVYSVENNGDKTRLGEATNINNISYSANFGIGINYNISKQLRFNLEPTFKYQINTFNDTSGNFQPFFIGVYTGLSFKF